MLGNNQHSRYKSLIYFSLIASCLAVAVAITNSLHLEDLKDGQETIIYVLEDACSNGSGKFD